MQLKNYLIVMLPFMTHLLWAICLAVMFRVAGREPNPHHWIPNIALLPQMTKECSAVFGKVAVKLRTQ